MSRALPPGIRDELGIEEFTEDLLLRLGRVRDEAAPWVIAERHGNRPGTARRLGADRLHRRRCGCDRDRVAAGRPRQVAARRWPPADVRRGRVA
jgi:hypothetical protein